MYENLPLEPPSNTEEKLWQFIENALAGFLRLMFLNTEL